MRWTWAVVQSGGDGHSWTWTNVVIQNSVLGSDFTREDRNLVVCKISSEFVRNMKNDKSTHEDS